MGDSSAKKYSQTLFLNGDFVIDMILLNKLHVICLLTNKGRVLIYTDVSLQHINTLNLGNITEIFGTNKFGSEDFTFLDQKNQKICSVSMDPFLFLHFLKKISNYELIDTIIQEIQWDHQIHCYFPVSFKNLVFCLLLSLRAKNLQNSIPKIPKFVLFQLIQFL